jgi:peroxiredoxin
MEILHVGRQRQEVVKTFVEDGKNNASEDSDPFEVSDAQTMLTYLKGNT